jgi:5-methylcytosine-specific restriction endonuclease McrA
MAESDSNLVLSEVKCKQCGGEIWTTPRKDGKARGNKKFCSIACGCTSRGRPRTGKTQAQVNAETAVRNTRACQRCGIQYVKKGKRNKSEGNKYCSRECGENRANYPYSILPEYTRLYAGDCKECGKPFVSRSNGAVRCSDECRRLLFCRNSVERAIRSDDIDRSVRDCKCCGKSFVPEYGSRRRIFCSDQCQKKGGRAIAKAFRRAYSRKYPCEKFSPYIVFNRDDWTCVACGRDTPKSARGTYEDNAPELDHVVPLSKGGHHMLYNAQTLCRSCNILKSNKTMGEFIRGEREGH